MEESEIKKLINMARNERLLAYSPYSGFSVGAALLCKNGEVICGCNIENASYGATNCAERTAVFKAISEGIKDFLAIAVVGGKSGEEPEDYAYPCGMCRQVLSEFCGSDFNVIVAKNTDDYKVYRLSEPLPEAFKL